MREFILILYFFNLYGIYTLYRTTPQEKGTMLLKNKLNTFGLTAVATAALEAGGLVETLKGARFSPDLDPFQLRQSMQGNSTQVTLPEL